MADYTFELNVQGLSKAEVKAQLQNLAADLQQADALELTLANEQRLSGVLPAATQPVACGSKLQITVNIGRCPAKGGAVPESKLSKGFTP
jgi:hypothetical protein